ncbi:MAG: alpha/beta hydrolase [Flavobacteriaceae bacterium]|nr:MAG: alpha/beta hydrolase [Flavobacteriaceae bacterium]
MSQFKKRTLFLNLLLVVFLSSSYAQQKTGNIVQYFGKEKINEINEGKLLHVFNKGLSLKVQDFTFNSSAFPVATVFEKFLMNPTLKIKAGEVFDIDATGNPLIWKKISTDTTNSFNDKNLRSSYIYLTYKSKSSKTVLFEASGHTLAVVNGLQHEGDHYDFGYNLIPLKLRKGLNTFVLKVGRFPRIRARLILPSQSVQFTQRDVTIPDILTEETKDYKGAIRVVNASNKWLKNYTITSELLGNALNTKAVSIAPMSVLKIPFSIASATDATLQTTPLKLLLKNGSKTVARTTLDIKIKTKHKHHNKTFISGIDGSVQYYSVAPSTDESSEKQALFLSVHGASVEAVNQANAYSQKDWGNVVAPTNRRPFGFAWEDWGRLDALEVLADAKNIYQPKKDRIYLTGHSMGGHGSWYLGATYPDYWAAIAPCAGYPDLIEYRNSFLKKVLELPQSVLTKRGMSPEIVSRLKTPYINNPVEDIMQRAGTPSRTLKLLKNYSHFGVYLLHGEKDNVVPTYIAQDMRNRLGDFHSDFVYHEYPDGTHWYGNHSLDWYMIFDFFKNRSIRDSKTIKNLTFATGSPGVSASSNFITLHQQIKPFEISSFDFSKDNGVEISTKNVATIQIDLDKIGSDIKRISLNGTTLNVTGKNTVFASQINDAWELTNAPSLKEKGPHRNGGFKDAFRNNVVFVYASKGSTAENEWYYNRARFDAETFWYRANGHIEVIKDTDFNPNHYTDRNVIVYGNKSNNAAWNKLLKHSPIQVSNNQVNFGGKKINGSQWGMYFIVPKQNSNIACVGVVTATGTDGMKAAYANHYMVNGTTFPDVLLFDNSVLRNGTRAVKAAGFFGNDWSIETGEFQWK